MTLAGSPSAEKIEAEEPPNRKMDQRAHPEKVGPLAGRPLEPSRVMEDRRQDEERDHRAARRASQGDERDEPQRVPRVKRRRQKEEQEQEEPRLFGDRFDLEAPPERDERRAAERRQRERAGELMA